jgi:4-amino-4-deoxy-L-arabinose transferase-like glycosyltransferase
MKYSWFIIILILFLLMHLPFLDADPDILSDRYSRSAWTDEGLYTSQIRNWVNHGEFSMWENDAFIKTPLFGIIHIPFFKIFGTGLIISRLIVLFTVFFSLLLFAKVKEFRLPALFIVLLAFSQYHIFHYTHYGLAEMMSISAIALSSLFFYKFYESRKNLHLFISALLIIISILLYHCDNSNNYIHHWGKRFY